MTEVQNIVTVILIVLGIFFMLIGSIGVVRLPDFYSRTHAVSTSDTLGIIFVITGLIIFTGFSLSSLKLAFIVVFVSLANPIGTHALTRAAYKQNIRPLLNGSDRKNTD